METRFNHSPFHKRNPHIRYLLSTAQEEEVFTFKPCGFEKRRLGKQLIDVSYSQLLKAQVFSYRYHNYS